MKELFAPVNFFSVYTTSLQRPENLAMFIVDQ